MRFQFYRTASRIILALLGLPQMLMAQHGDSQFYTITAKVQNADSTPIDIGNVMILTLSDSSVIGGSVFYDGRMTIDNISMSHFILKITALGYKDYVREIRMKNPSHVLAPITLVNDYLEQIVVTANQNSIEKIGTKTLVDVANTSLRDAGTVRDVLQNVPKIDIDRNGQISITGKGQASVFVDGQRIASTQMLNNISSVEIARIEIMENPPASFDAAGNAVINIITKTKTLEGYKLGITQEAGWGKHFRSFFQADAYLKIKGFMIQGDYSIRPQTIGNWFRQARTHLSDNNPYFTDNRYLLVNKWLGHNFSLRTAYKFGNGISVGLNYSGTDAEARKTGNNHRIGEAASNPVLDIRTLVTGITGQKSQTATLYLNNNEGENLTYQFQTQYAGFSFDRNELSDQNIKSNGGINASKSTKLKPPWQIEVLI